jgi:hypothetical protein
MKDFFLKIINRLTLFLERFKFAEKLARQYGVPTRPSPAQYAQFHYCLLFVFVWYIFITDEPLLIHNY